MRPGARPKARPGPAPGLAVRTTAVEILSATLDRRQPFDNSFDAAHGDAAWRALPERDRRLVRAIVTTALRRHGETEAVLARLIERPPRRAGRLFRILEVAAVQILHMDVPDHAAVSVAMEQVGADRDAAHFKGLANAVLRRVARERQAILAAIDMPRRAVPDWLWQRWVAAYGEADAGRIAAANLEEPSLDLTVRSDPALWAEKVGGVVLPTGSVRLIQDGPVEALAGFAEGAWWVQDAAAALPPRLFGDIAGKRVADLCAAPGGKTVALAAAGAEVVAVDISEPPLRRVSANLERLGLAAEIVETDLFSWRPAEPFDAILLDAPCTATGTIRRHADIAWNKRPEDVTALADAQAQMIDRAVGWLKPGGMFVFSTCSIEPEEGEHQMARAIHRHGLEIVPVEAAEIGGPAECVLPSGAVRTLPFHLAGATPRLSGLDGFFMMRLRKR
ncbi:MAG: methyltransferase domain-containing protein [Rhizobiales bacterium]|nr:methyltransferase domain-containing protein [Hyphomicrobiales bacterium]